MKTEIIYFDKKETAPAKELRGVGGVGNKEKEVWEMTFEEYELIRLKYFKQVFGDLTILDNEGIVLSKKLDNLKNIKPQRGNNDFSISVGYNVNVNRQKQVDDEQKYDMWLKDFRSVEQQRIENNKEREKELKRIEASYLQNSEFKPYYKPLANSVYTPFYDKEEHKLVVIKALQDKKNVPLSVVDFYNLSSGEKEYWQMTFSDYFDLQNTNISIETYLQDQKKKKPKYSNVYKSNHLYHINRAMRFGLIIPAEVLAEYPDLLKNQATNLLQQYKNDSEGLGGLGAKSNRQEVLSREAMQVLKKATIQNDEISLNSGVIERKVYEEIKETFDRLGGKWKTKGKKTEGVPNGVFVFAENHALALLNAVLESGLMPENNPSAYFPTPEKVVKEMIEIAGYYMDFSDLQILEPSAGTGGIAEIVRERNPEATIDLVEFSPFNAKVLRNKGFENVFEMDFLEFKPKKEYDIVFMNPPFALVGDATAWITHIKHAYSMLKSDGILVAITPEFMHKTDSKTVAFKQFMACNGGIVDSQVPRNTFADTAIATNILLFDRQNKKSKTEKYNGFPHFDIWHFIVVAENNDMNNFEKLRNIYKKAANELWATKKLREEVKKWIESSITLFSKTNILFCLDNADIEVLIQNYVDDFQDYLKDQLKDSELGYILSSATDLLADYKNDSQGLAGLGAKKEFWQMTLDEYLLVAPKELLVASAGSFANIKKIIAEYYYGEKELVNLSTELMYRYKVQGNRNGKDYFHKADRVFYNEKKRTFYFEQVKSHEDIIKKAITENKPIPAEVLAEYPDLLKEKATNLLQQYKNDSQGLQGTQTPQGLKAGLPPALAGLQNISFTAYITAANPRQDKQKGGRSQLLQLAQINRIGALQTGNVSKLKKSELLFDKLAEFNQKAIGDDLMNKKSKSNAAILKYIDFSLIGYWAGQPEPSVEINCIAKTKSAFWHTIIDLTNFAQKHSQDAFIVSVPLTNAERTAIEKDEILINTQTADGFWYSPVFNLPFADLTTKEQLSIEAEFYKTFGEVGFSMYIYKSKINNRTVNYKLIFSHEIAKNIKEFGQIIVATLYEILQTNKTFGVSKRLAEQIRQIGQRIRQDIRQITTYEKVMFFAADSFEGDSRSYSKVLAEIGKRMRGLGGVAGLGAKSVELFDGLMTYTPNSKGLGRSEAEIEQQAKKQNLGLLLAVEFALFSIMKQLDISFENIRQYLSKGTISKDFSEIDKVLLDIELLRAGYQRSSPNILTKPIQEVRQNREKYNQDLQEELEKLYPLLKNLQLPSKAIATEADDNEEFWLTDKEYFAIRDRYAAGKKNLMYPVSIRYDKVNFKFEFITDKGKFTAVLWTLSELADRMQKEYGFRPSASLDSLLNKNVQNAKNTKANSFVISELHTKILKRFVTEDTDPRSDSYKTINSNSTHYGTTNAEVAFMFPHTEQTASKQGCFWLDGRLVANERLLVSDETLQNILPKDIAEVIEIDVVHLLKFAKFNPSNDYLEKRVKRLFYQNIFLGFGSKTLKDVLQSFLDLKYKTIYFHLSPRDRTAKIFSVDKHYFRNIFAIVMPFSFVSYGDYYPKNDDTDEMGNGLVWYDLENGFYPATFKDLLPTTSQTPMIDAAKLQARAAKQAKTLLSQYKKDSQGLGSLGDMPVVLREEGFKFLFYSNEHLPVHIHIEKGNAKAKFHLEPDIELIYNQGFTQKEIKKIREIIAVNYQNLVTSWHNFFDR